MRQLSLVWREIKLRVFISRLSALGDVVCTLPVAAAIKDTWTDAEVVWAVDKRFRAIVDACGAVDQVVVRPKPMEMKGLGKFDVALDMQGLLKSGLLVAACSASRKLGYQWQREGSSLFSQRVLPDPSSIHVVDQYVDVARAFGATADRAEFRLNPDPAAIERVREKLVTKGWDGGKLVVVNAGAGWATKRWAANKFAALADRAETHVAFLGAPSDRETFAEVRNHGAARAIDMVGETSVAELVALIGLASAHVGGDTGSTHIAAALGVPAIGIYTLTRPERSCPYGQIERCFAGDPSVDEVCDKLDGALC